MLKYSVIVVFCTLSVECLNWGDNCITSQNQYGTCIPLSTCRHLLIEIRNAGNPMPIHMRQKLQSLGCGFHISEPLVCCAPDDDDSNDEPVRSDTERSPYNNDLYLTSDNWMNNANTEDPFNRKGSQNSINNKGPPDISQHPNLRLLPTNCGNIEDDRIWGGDSTQLYQMPWMVLLSYQDVVIGPRLSCGGTLITEWYVLTAAHCVEFLSSRMTLESVVLGEYDIRTNPDCEDSTNCAPPIRKVRFSRVIAHPGYTPETLRDDIALLRLSEPADFSLDTMKPICLPITSDLQRENLDNKSVVVAGWGVTEEGMQSSVLMSVNLPVVSNQNCMKDYDNQVRIIDGQMCAGGEKDKDSCSGDSGGPLMYPGKVGRRVQYVQRGIVSYGSKRCALGGYPAIYTRVAYYMDWILDNISS